MHSSYSWPFPWQNKHGVCTPESQLPPDKTWWIVWQSRIQYSPVYKTHRSRFRRVRWSALVFVWFLTVSVSIWIPGLVVFAHCHTHSWEQNHEPTWNWPISEESKLDMLSTRFQSQKKRLFISCQSNWKPFLLPGAKSATYTAASLAQLGQTIKSGNTYSANGSQEHNDPLVLCDHWHWNFLLLKFCRLQWFQSSLMWSCCFVCRDCAKLYPKCSHWEKNIQLSQTLQRNCPQPQTVQLSVCRHHNHYYSSTMKHSTDLINSHRNTSYHDTELLVLTQRSFIPNELLWQEKVRWKTSRNPSRRSSDKVELARLPFQTQEELCRLKMREHRKFPNTDDQIRA